ncbi:hypothetical protein Tco_0772415 [Tanacetum coccineum]|uniref:Uncharacterized protein n=1 Tax=Tanacetum coccineum TaxID=301880 RepID=A0ABQ4ZHU1_9ASTR
MVEKRGVLFARLIKEFGFALHQVRSRLVSDSTTRDVEWEPIEEERLEEPKEGWMLGESKKRSIRISSRMLIVGLVPRSRVTLVKARCLRFVGKRTNVNARSRRSTKVDESKLCDIPVVLEYVRLDNQSIERDRLIGIGFVLNFAKFISFTFGDREMMSVIEAILMVVDVRTLIIEEAHATKYSVRPGVSKIHGVHMSSIPDKDGMYIEVLEWDVEVIRNTSRYEYCLPSID